MRRRNILFILMGTLFSLFTLATAWAEIEKDHLNMIWTGTQTCLKCHEEEAAQVHASVHYQWKGAATEIVNGQPIQGKYAGAMNAYCINILGNWTGCGSCHVGLGAKPEANPTLAQLRNIDCLLCHQEQYKRKNVNGTYVPDTANMTISMNQAAQTVHEPNRATCLQCHAKGGGGDNYKRGDMPLSLAKTTDKNFDVHMATTGKNMSCQKCHEEDDHKMAGRGSDLRPTDLNEPIGCATTECHSSMRHDDASIDSHGAKIACQTCHIKTFARDAVDTPATDATEMHRDWRTPKPPAADGKIHPSNVMKNNVKPKYRFWNGQSSVYNLNDPATIDPGMGIYLISKPEGSIADTTSKLYPFKYKTAIQPLATNLNILVPLDTSVYFKTGDANAATRSGFTNIGKNANEPFTYVTTGEFQLITHEVTPEDQALKCTECHGTTAQMNMKSIGYGLKGTKDKVCSSCHDDYSTNSGKYSYTTSYTDFTEMHKEHPRKEMDCNKCHSFSRPLTTTTTTTTTSSSNNDGEHDDDHSSTTTTSSSTTSTSACYSGHTYYPDFKVCYNPTTNTYYPGLTTTASNTTTTSSSHDDDEHDDDHSSTTTTASACSTGSIYYPDFNVCYNPATNTYSMGSR